MTRGTARRNIQSQSRLPSDHLKRRPSSQTNDPHPTAPLHPDPLMHSSTPSSKRSSSPNKNKRPADNSEGNPSKPEAKRTKLASRLPLQARIAPAKKDTPLAARISLAARLTTTNASTSTAPPLASRISLGARLQQAEATSKPLALRFKTPKKQKVTLADTRAPVGNFEEEAIREPLYLNSEDAGDSSEEEDYSETSSDRAFINDEEI